MTEFNDVCSKYDEIFDKYSKLRILLIRRLTRQKVEADFDNLNFEELIHLIDTIQTKEYNISNNIKPSLNYNLESFRTHLNQDVETDVSLCDFNENLFNITWYYIRLLRYYLVYKGVSISLVNAAYTLEDHILLIDFIPRIKSTILTVTLNTDGNLYYGNNVFNINIVDEDEYPVTEGQICFYQDGLRVMYPISDTIEINMRHMDAHSYSFQYINEERNYLDSNIVEFNDLEVQPMPLTFNAHVYNSILRDYLDKTDSIKGYINDYWNIYGTIYDINGKPVTLPITIQIDDPDRQIETQSFVYYETKLLLHNNENNDNPIHITVSTPENVHYIFNQNLVEFDVNILYPSWTVTPTFDYTGKESYQFELTFFDEYTGEPISAFDGSEVHAILQSEDNTFIDNNFTIENGTATIIYNNNLPIDTYILELEIDSSVIDLIIEILPNVEYPDEVIYLGDEPQIKIINNIDIDALIIRIVRGSDNESEDIHFDIDEIDEATYFPINIDENGYLILPDEYKQVGTYYVRIENNITEEEFEFSYTIRYPYEYYSEGTNDIKIFYINIEDYNHFDYNNITDYIKIYEYDEELEYEYSIYNEGIIVTADKDVNSKFKGINTFYININNYIQTEEFTLLDDENIYEIINDVEIGDSDVVIACYDNNINEINVTIMHNGNEIGMHTVTKENTENFVFVENFPELGEYTFIIDDGERIEEYTIEVDKAKLKTQEFKFNSIIDSSESPDITNSLGFGFTDKNHIDEDITIIFYYDNPQNILDIKTINSKDSSYHVYTDKFLGNNNIPSGSHTLYASFDGNSDNYKSFIISKVFYKKMETRIIYDKEDMDVTIGERFELPLLAIDEFNNVVNKGYYIINDEIYYLDERILITARTTENEYNIRINYVGEDEYKDSIVNITYNVTSGIYDYYANSMEGDNENDGLTPFTAVQNMNTLINISQPNDLLCVMAGSYEYDTITRDTIIYGYYLDNIDNIKVRINKIGPNTRLILKDVSLDTGEGYGSIVGSYEFINDKDYTVDLSVIPGEYTSAYDVIYNILIDENIYTVNDSIVITGVTIKNDKRIGNKLVKIYQNDELIKAVMSNDNGEFIFSLNNNQQDNIMLEITKCKINLNIN